VVKAIVDPVWTRLEGLPLLDRERVDKAFAVKIPGVMFQPRFRRMIKSGVWDGCYHFFEKNEYRIPTGLLPKLLPLIPGLEIEDHSLEGLRDQYLSAQEAARTIQVNGIRFTERQRAAIIAAVDHRRGFVKIATGGGKTEVGSGLIRALDLPTLWVVPSKDLLYQTAERLEQRLGCPVGRIGDGRDTSCALVDVGMMQSIRPRKKDWKNRLTRYNVVIFDEAHHLASNTQQTIAKALINAPFRYALSGSPPDDEMRRLKIMAMTDATLLYDLSNAELIESGWSAKPIIHVKHVKHPGHDDEAYKTEYQVPSGISADEREVLMEAYEEDPEKAKGILARLMAEADEGVQLETIRRVEFMRLNEDLIAKNKAFADIVADEVARWYMQNLSALVLVDRIHHGEALGRLLHAKGLRFEFLNGSHSGEYRREKLAEFKAGSLPVIIATNIFDEGVDVPRVQALVLAGGGKSSVRMLQRIGRALRNKRGMGENVAHIVFYAHEGSKYLEAHARQNLKLFRDEKFELVEEETFTV
jgi:superfamily II DNA or RNA helicase